MMNWLGYTAIVLLATFAGWFTIWAAVKMLFHPKKPISVLGFRLYGIFPKNQQLIAENLGGLVSKELVSFDEIENKITDPENLQKLKPEIEAHIDDFLRNRLKDTFPMISMFIGDKTINQLKNAFLMELEALFPILMKKYMVTMQDKFDLEKIITEKVAAFSSEKLEANLSKAIRKEFVSAELAGAAFGFLIGLIQVLIICCTN